MYRKDVVSDDALEEPLGGKDATLMLNDLYDMFEKFESHVEPGINEAEMTETLAQRVEAGDLETRINEQGEKEYRTTPAGRAKQAKFVAEYDRVHEEVRSTLERMAEEDRKKWSEEAARRR